MLTEPAGTPREQRLPTVQAEPSERGLEMNTGYMLYQVQRPKSAREQYEIDRSNARLAAAIGRFGRLLARPARPRRQTWRPAPGRPAPCPETSQ